MCEGVSLDNAVCREEYKTYTSFWILGVAGTLIASLGIFLNTFGLFIIWKSKAKHLFKGWLCAFLFSTQFFYSFQLLISASEGLSIGIHLLFMDFPILCTLDFIFSCFAPSTWRFAYRMSVIQHCKILYDTVKKFTMKNTKIGK